MICLVNQLMVFTSKKQKRPTFHPKKSCNQLGGWKLDSYKNTRKPNGWNRLGPPQTNWWFGLIFFSFSKKKAFLRCKNVSVLGVQV